MITISFREFLLGEQAPVQPSRLRCVGHFVSFDQWLENAGNDPPCPKCGAKMVLRTGKYGSFYGCSQYGRTKCPGKAQVPKGGAAPAAAPAVSNAPAPAAQPTQAGDSPPCPKCGGPMTIRTARQGRNAGGQFWGCNAWRPGGKGCDGTLGYNPNAASGASPKAEPEPERGQQSGATNFTEPEEVATRENSMIPDHLISEEQREIDEKFARMRASSSTGHMMVSALAGSGKAQPLDALLLTPSGWTTMGEISVGDMVIGSDGKPHEVVGVFPQGEKEVFEVEFTDGAKTECCGDHLWFTETKANRDLCHHYKVPVFSRGKVSTTKDLIDDLTYRDRPKHYIPLTQPVEMDWQEVPIEPYTMGFLLGDGCFRDRSISYSTKDQEIIEHINNNIPESLTSKYRAGCDYTISSGIKGRPNEIKDAIADLGLLEHKSEDKFIPNVYKYNNIETRVAILQGLFDSDGYVQTDSNHVEYSTSSEMLMEDVRFLVESLGGTVRVTQRLPKFTYKGKKKTSKHISYRLYAKLPSGIEPFRLKRKLERFTPRTKYMPRRVMESIKPIGLKECQCISIDSPDNLYMTNNCILTHNTSMLRHLAWKYGKPGEKWLYLVFNAKNKVEATEKFPADIVKVRTTHGFLGSEELLGHALNKQKIAQTDRIAELRGMSRGTDEEEDKQKLDKASIIADTPEFARIMNEYGIQTKKLHPDDDDILGKVIETIKSSIQYQFKNQTLRLIGLCKNFSLDPRNEGSLKEGMSKILDSYDFDTSMSDIKERIQNYKSRFSSQVQAELKRIMGYDFMNKDFKEEIEKAAVWLLKETMPNATKIKFGYGKDKSGKSMEHELGHFRDFDDDLWFAAVHANEIHWPKFDVVLADEVQDFNEAQITVLKKLAEAGAQVVAVGDKKQALYRFRGAHSQGFQSIGDMLGNMSHPEHRYTADGREDVVKKLTKNFRSRKAVIDFHNAEQQGMPGFTDEDKLIQGRYVDDPDNGLATKFQIKYPEAFDQIKQEKAAGQVKETAFISRTNAPLVHTALQLLTAGVPFVMTGKDIAGDLMKHIVSVIKRYRLRDNNYSMDLANKMHEFHDQQSNAHAASASKAAYVQNLKETTDALLAAIDQFHKEESHDGRPTIAQFKQWIAEKLGKNSFDVTDKEEDFKAFRSKVRKEKPVVLTTSHRSKGMEWDRVFILRYDQFPHPKSKRQEDLEQESNAKGVALGRAKHEIHVLDLEGQPGYVKK